MKYQVKTFRDAGLVARWGKTRKGAPIIFLKSPYANTKHQRNNWWACDKSMFEIMQTDGIHKGFNDSTLLGDIFSIPA